MKDVLKCIITVSGEQCVMMDSLTQQQELFVTHSDLGMYKPGTDVFDTVFIGYLHQRCTSQQITVTSSFHACGGLVLAAAASTSRCVV